MASVWLLAAALLGLVAVGSATIGVDVSQATYPDAFQCLKNAGYSFAIIRAYESIGQPDSTAPHTIYNAWDGGMTHVDIYMFPDPSSNNPSAQVDSMLEYLAQFNIHTRTTPPATYGMVWLDIEGTQYWSGDVNYNRNFFSALVARLQAQGQYVGVYTSASQWNPIMGDWAGGAKLPLWYAHYDNSPSFSDFSPFGGWTSPSIKQYQGDASACGAGIDINWYPDFANATRANPHKTA
eukprot:m.228805 g.228805  ORF g.228805 m.228805 type:complete len:237 (+) comp17602_c0_seq1:22-732(+)